jgi:hypothetical protein
MISRKFPDHHPNLLRRVEAPYRIAVMTENQSPEYKDFEELDFNIVKSDLDRCLPDY